MCNIIQLYAVDILCDLLVFIKHHSLTCELVMIVTKRELKCWVERESSERPVTHTDEAYLLLLSGQTLFVPAQLLLLQFGVKLLHLMHLFFLPLYTFLIFFYLINVPLLLLFLGKSKQFLKTSTF